MDNFILLSVFLCIFFLPAVVFSDDAVVLLRTEGNVDVKALYDVPETSAVYKIKPIKFWGSKSYQSKYLKPKDSLDNNPRHMKKNWNYMILAKGFASSEAQDEYKKKISKFAKTHYLIPLTINPNVKVDFLNGMIKNLEKDKDLVKRPLDAAYPTGCERTYVEGTEDDDKIFVMSFVKYKNRKKLKQYAGRLLRKVFPALGVRYVYSGQIPGQEWEWLDAFTIMDFVNKKTWCEYALSKLVKGNIKISQKAFQAAGSLTGVLVKG